MWFARKLALLLLLVAVPATASLSLSAEGEAPQPGTVITHQNWQQYKDYMTHGLQVLFSGSEFWKLPPDAQIVVGPTHHYSLPALYLKNTERYASQVRAVMLPNGEHGLEGYVAGQPFPDPKPPLQGWKILANAWYTYTPSVICGWIRNTNVDRFNNTQSSELLFVYRRAARNSNPGAPIDEPGLPGIDTTEHFMALLPEQNKYVAELVLYYLDYTKNEDLFLFIPGLRRVLRLSAAARCSPFFGTDFTQDDTRYGYLNSGIARFDADLTAVKKILVLTDSKPELYGNFDNYYRPLFFPKPVVGKWELRDTYILDLHRIPSQAKGYCYSHKILYVDKENVYPVWADIYDESGKFWKIGSYAPFATEVPGIGKTLNVNNFWATMYDLQNDHLTYSATVDEHGHAFRGNQQCENYLGNNFDRIEKYSTISGLNSIVQ